MIKFEQANPVPGQDLYVTSEELFVFHMNKAFGQFPVELNKEHIERLIGMGATYAEPNPFAVLIRAIKSLGTIKVWRE